MQKVLLTFSGLGSYFIYIITLHIKAKSYNRCSLCNKNQFSIPNVSMSVDKYVIKSFINIFIQHIARSRLNLLHVYSLELKTLSVFSSSSSFFLSPPDVNDNVPFFTSSIYEASVTEGAQIGTSVLQVSAHDKDLGLNGQVRKSPRPFQPHKSARFPFGTQLFQPFKNP